MDKTDALENSGTVEFLSFRVRGEEYAIDIGSTLEIRSWSKPSTLPDVPTFFLGVINLRGAMLPLLDLAARLGLSTPEVNDKSVIIVAEIEETPVGLLVDGVSDIIALSKEDMQPPPDMANASGNSYVRALTLVGDKTVRILDVTSLMSASEQAA